MLEGSQMKIEGGQMRKRVLSVLCGTLLVLCLGHASAFAAGSDDSREVSDAQVSETAESNRSEDDGKVVEGSVADETTGGENDEQNSAEASDPTAPAPSGAASTPTSSDSEAVEDDAQFTGLLNYRSHVQSLGWQDWAKDGTLSGTTGRALRVEALQIKLGNGLSGSIEYCAHVQNLRWQPWVKDGAISGTTGQSLRMEALRIRLTGDVAKKYSVRYRVHVQNIGWTAWSYNGEVAGTEGKSLRVEAVEVQLVEKPEASVMGHAHVQDVGWTSPARGDVVTLGVTGRSKRLEAFSLSLDGVMCPEGDDSHIEYCAHVQNVDWQKFVSDGANAGTVGKGLRIEAVKIKLSGPIAQKYDVWYRAHVQDYGWLAWTKDDGIAGTTGLSKRVEAIQVSIRAKGSAAPTSNGKWALASFGPAHVTYSAHVQNIGWEKNPSADGQLSGTTGRSLRIEAFKASVKSDNVTGDISYSAHVQDKGWMSAVSNNVVAGTVGQGKRVEAFKFSLTGDMATYYDVWYRAYVQDYGWLGWTKNGSVAGSTGIGYRVEAFEVKVLAKGAPAPGPTGSPYVTKAKSRVHFHNIHAVGQPNGFFCGPTSGYMVLSNVGAWRSKSGTQLSIENVASYMRTRSYGYTSFADRMFEKGMNGWLGRSVYTTYHTPSYATVRSSVLKSYSTGYATCVDEQERRGGPHFNGHGNTTFSHIMVVDGYNEATDQVYFADPACSLYAGASPHFWYPSLRTFTNTYLAQEYIRDGRQHIGIYTSR